MRGVGRRRGAASSVGTRRESILGGSVATSMPPHGPAPGRGTTLPRSLSLIRKQYFKHVLMPADFVADVISKPSICCHVARNGRSEERAAHLAVRISFSNRQQPLVQAPAADRSVRMEPAEALHKIARSAALVGSAAPHPVSGHAGNPSLETRWRRPQQT
ncbi:hypothetical protein XaplCFBP3123_02845 [Xanthomonas arboricola pv. populi]|nr:hypothetical protein C1H21_04215 [Xanthomonas arboricola pv. juglandis]PPU42081.1 hypothetical protein XaplCFBP3123_02845 [Xanthomonas arboricola pv. populi]